MTFNIICCIILNVKQDKYSRVKEIGNVKDRRSSLTLNTYFRQEENIMNDVIEKISKTISETGKVVSEKTKLVGETARLNSKILSKEGVVRSNYSAIGEFYYNKYKDAPDEDIAETINDTTAALNAIDEMKAQLLSLKGAVKCVECGAECPIDNSYCGHCGAKLVKPEPPKEEEPAGETEQTEAANSETGEAEEEKPEVLEGEVIDTDKTEE